jgi:DNA-binding SARP family transcriptional activator
MDSLRVCLFGKFDARFGERVLCGFHRRKVQELFGYLLLNREHPLPRETLAGLLWDDGSTTFSKKQLRQTLWQLQTALEPECEPASSHVLRVEPDWVYLNPAIDLWLDVSAFEQASALAQGIPGLKLDADKVAALQEAVQLYHGDLLEGCYQGWCLYERERLQSMHLTMLDKLMGYCEVHRKYELGLVYGARILSCDPASVPTDGSCACSIWPETARRHCASTSAVSPPSTRNWARSPPNAPWNSGNRSGQTSPLLRRHCRTRRARRPARPRPRCPACWIASNTSAPL